MRAPSPLLAHLFSSLHLLLLLLITISVSRAQGVVPLLYLFLLFEGLLSVVTV